MTVGAHGQESPPTDCAKAAARLPNGARFYRCALQVNPFAYLARHKKTTDFRSEDEYNKAIVEACLENGIEVIAVTDHYRIKESAGLLQAAREAGLFAFGGFEAVTKDGVHFLCLFDPGREDSVERIIGECGVHGRDDPSPTGDLDSAELLERSRKKWKATCIAAHALSGGGLLKTLSGQTRINVWKHPDLLACVLPGPTGDAPDSFRGILENRNAEYRRSRRIAILNASDVTDPEDLKEHRTSCFIKMSAVSVEGLRQAFLDPESRIRLHSDPIPDAHAELLEITWEGGFLHDTALRFNENLNVLIGGRGTGKSTMIESIRYALGLEPLGEEARKAHQDIVKYVLQPGTKVSLRIQSHKPAPRSYTIERSVPNPPVVKDNTGSVLPLAPLDVLPGVEVFGQHEISELARIPEKLTALLERFVDGDPSRSGRKSELRSALEKSRRRIVGAHEEIRTLEERLAALPSLEEMHKRFQQTGLEERLRTKSLLVREEALFSQLEDRLGEYRLTRDELVENLPVDTVFVSAKALDGLPNADVLAAIEGILQTLSAELETAGKQFGRALDNADHAIREARSLWKQRCTTVEEDYEKQLRELQPSKVDGTEFIQLREQIETLRPLKDRTANLRRSLEAYEAERRNLLAEWEDTKAAEYQEIKTAARKVTKKLGNRVRVEVTMAGNRAPLEHLLREEVGGNLAPAIDHLQSREELSLPELAQRCREGKDSLVKHYGLPTGAAQRIAEAGSDLHMRIEELELPAITDISLNTAPEGQDPAWRTLKALSTGQKATAVLLLLLLESEAPLVVDQPEDDLDNRFITEGVVPTMRREKRRRQFVFSTHNANIPVLGDAELIVGLAATGDDDPRANVSPEHIGSIDSEPVKELVEEVLEGGRAAFEMRRSRYGF